MSFRRACVFFFLAVAVTEILPRPAQSTEWMDTEVLTPLVYVFPVESALGGTAIFGAVMMGSEDGVVRGDRLLLQRPDPKEGLLKIGFARIDSLTEGWGVGRLDATPPDSARVGDLVQVRLRIPRPERERLTWDVARNAVTFTNADGDTLCHFLDVLHHPDRYEDDAFFAACAQQIVSITPRIEEHPNAQIMIDTGRYKGQRLLDVLKAVTPPEVRAFFHYVRSYPGKYAGQTFRIEESFAGWASSGGPLSAHETIERAAGLDDAHVKQLLEEFHDIFLEELPIENWYVLSRDAWLAGNHDRSREILRIMRLSAEVMALPRWWFFYWTALADIEAWAGDYDAALQATAEGIIAAGLDSSALGNLHHNRATILEDMKRYDEALAAYEEALSWKGAGPDTFATSEGGSSWSGLGRCYNRLQRYEEAAQAFRTAVRFFEMDAGLEALERLATTYSNLGDVYKSMGRYGQAIDAWRHGRTAAERLGWKKTMADALVKVSDGHWDLGEYLNAVHVREQAEAIYQGLGNRHDVAIALTNLGELHWTLGEVDTARACFGRARTLHGELGEGWDLGDVCFREGSHERGRGDHQAALRQLEEARRLFTTAQDTTALAKTDLEMAEACEGLGRHAEADSYYVSSQRGFQEAKDRAQEAKVLEWWGWTLQSRKQASPARIKLEAALAAREAIGDLAGQTDCLRRVSDILAGQEGENDKAMETATRALAIAEEMPSKPKMAEAHLTLGTRDFEHGRLDVAFAHHRQALTLFEETGDVGGQGRAHDALGGLLEARGDFPASMREYRTALSLADSAQHVGLKANVLGAMAWQLHLEGRYAPAESLAHEGLALQEGLGNEWGTAYLINTLASCAEATGRFDEALRLNDQARAIRESWSDLFGLSASENNIASTLMRMRDFPGAVPHLEKALALGEQLGYYEVLIATVSNLAECYMELGRGEDALAMAQRALATAERTGAAPRAAQVQELLGRIERKLGRLDEARASLQAGLARADSLGDLLTALGARAELGYVEWASGHPEAAARLLEPAIAEMETFRNPIMLWEPLLFLGRARRDARDAAGAVEAYRRSVTTLEDVRRGIAEKTRADQFQANHGDVYRELVDLLTAQGRGEEAWQVVGLMKSQELQDMQTVPGSERASGEARDAAAAVEGLRSRESLLVEKLRGEFSRPKAEQRGELITAWQSEIDSLKLAFHDYVEALRLQKPEIYARLEIPPVSFQKLQASLQDSEAFIEPLVLPDRVVVFVVRGGTDPLVVRETEVPEARVLDLIREMRERLAQPTVAWESRTAALAVDPAVVQVEDPTEPARALHQLLIAPILGDLAGIKTLVVSPSGRLRYIPFAALYDGHQYLIDRFEVALLTQAGTLAERAPLTANAPMLAFGNPDGTLPGAENEVKALARMWAPGPVTAYYGAEASKDTLRAHLAGCRILHLATHGVLQNDNPEGSYLLLAGTGLQGHLTLRDILLLPLAQVDLAVLSACQTAMGEKGEGREIAGLAYTFEQTGAGSILASLWNVNDKSTADLMAHFYEDLRRGRTTRASALRGAQLAIRNQADFAHPYFWAPFVLVGNWR